MVLPQMNDYKSAEDGARLEGAERDPDEELAAICDLVFGGGPSPVSKSAVAPTGAALVRMLSREWAILEVYRWFAATGRVASVGDWDGVEGLPSVAEIDVLFGGWQGLIAASGIEEQALPVHLPRLRGALAGQRAAAREAQRRLRVRERDVEAHDARLHRREAELRSQLLRDVERRVTEAERQSSLASTAQQGAEADAASARRDAAEAEEQRQLALRHAHALGRRLADAAAPDGASPVFAAWYQFPSGSFDALLAAVAQALAGGALREQIESAAPGVVQLGCGAGILEIERPEATAAYAIHLTHSEPILGVGEELLCGEDELTLAAHRRLTVSLWQTGLQAGALVEVRVIDAPLVLPAAELAQLAGRLVQAARPEPDAGWPLGTRATRVGVREVEELVAFIRDGARSRPVLVLTGDLTERTAEDPDLLAAELCGAAHVVEVEADATFRLTDLLPPKLSVWGGQARCYRPGFGEDSPPQRHPRLDPRRFDAHAQLHNELLLLACEPDRATCAADALGQARAGAPAKSMRELEQELDEQRRLNAELAGALADGAEPAHTAREQLRSVTDAAALARLDAQHLRFAAKAFKTAAESPYRPAIGVYDALMLLDRLAGEYLAGEIGVSLGQRAAQLGLTWRADVSETARSRYAEEYICAYEGIALPLGPHVVVANGTGASRNCRIYFHVAGGGRGLARGIYVGHIGRHLPDSTT
jgi:hypothetical protein